MDTVIDLAKSEHPDDKVAFYCTVYDESPCLGVSVSSKPDGGVKVMAYHMYVGTEQERERWIAQAFKEVLIDMGVITCTEDGESLDVAKWQAL